MITQRLRQRPSVCFSCLLQGRAAFTTALTAQESNRPRNRRSNERQTTTSGDSYSQNSSRRKSRDGGPSHESSGGGKFGGGGKSSSKGKTSKGQGKVASFSITRSGGKPNPETSLLDALNDFRLRLFDDAILARLGYERSTLQEEYSVFLDKARRHVKAQSGKPHFMLDRITRVLQAERLRGEMRSGALSFAVRNAFLNHLLRDEFNASVQRSQAAVLNLSHPTEWWPGARHMQRTIHMHVGPTNSGKTYHALKRLEAADRGLYAGPLRLLAHEVYLRLNAAGKQCNLVTGDDRRSGDVDSPAATPMTSCTVEMVSTHTDLDVAVIDEIQMIGHPERAWAWTQAVMGVRAREVHLCGEARAVPIIKQLMAAVGEEVIVHEYGRLSPLELARTSLDGDLSRLQKGDCIVAFTVITIHALRRTIEERTGKKCAIIYGSLPAETRVQQARLFNEPDNDYDYLVASNAVGMGLNLAIRRIIFQSSIRYDGHSWITLDDAEIKQIGGRAGRYSNAQEDTSAANVADVGDGRAPDSAPPAIEEAAKGGRRQPGLVTTLEAIDFGAISKGMRQELQPIQKAGFLPPDDVLARFAMYFSPKTPTSYILTRMLELAKTSRLFFMCDMEQLIGAADVIEDVQGLSWAERTVLLQAPFNVRNGNEWPLVQEMAQIVADKRSVDILELRSLDLDLLDDNIEISREYLRALEDLHKGIVTYMWLGYRFVLHFLRPALTRHVKELVEQRIEEVIEKTAFAYDRNLVKFRREKALRDLLSTSERGGADKAEGDAENFEPPADPTRELVAVDASDDAQAVESTEVSSEDALSPPITESSQRDDLRA